MAAESCVSSYESLGHKSAAKEVSNKIFIVIANSKYKLAGTFPLGELCNSQEWPFLSPSPKTGFGEKNL